MIGYMNLFETWFVHSWPRWLLQRWWEMRILFKLGLRFKGKNVLEIGCGTGRAAIAMKKMGAMFVLATDLDTRYVIPRSHKHATVLSMDATNLSSPEASFDVVVGFGVLHHVPQWEKVVQEAARVLKPGGIYALDDFTASGLKKWYHFPFDAPTENRFTTGDLIRCLNANGLDVEDMTHRLAGDVVFLVARKRGSS